MTEAHPGARASAAGTRLASSAAELPVWAWLGALIVLSAGVRFGLALRNPGPWIFHDEIAYSDLAKSLAETGGFAVRNSHGTQGYGPLYPALIAPAFALFDRVPDAYVAVRAINSVLMSLAAIPAYLFARRFVTRRLALVVAALSLAIPAFSYTATVMTENAAYPLFLAAMLGILLALERPTAGRQLGALAAIAVAYFVRPQAIALVPALLTGTVLVAVLAEGPARRRLRRLYPYWPAWAGVGVAAVAILLAEVLRGRSATAFLGGYEGLRSYRYAPGPIVRWFVYHLGEIDLATGFIPVVAFFFLLLAGWRMDSRAPGARLFAVAGASIVVWFVLLVAAYASTPTGQRIEERYLIYLAPLFFTGLALWLEAGMPRRAPAFTVAVALGAGLPAAIPYASFVNNTAVHSTQGLLPLWKVQEILSYEPQLLSSLVVLAALVAATLALALPRPLELVLPAVVLAYLLLAQIPVEQFTHAASKAAFDVGAGRPADWIDRAVPKSAHVTALWTGGNVHVLWQNEFFNGRIDRVATVVGGHDGLPEEPYGIDPATGILQDDRGQAARSDFVLAEPGVMLQGPLVARDPRTQAVLYRIGGGPIAVRSRVDGMYPDGWSLATTTYSRYGCRGGRLTVRLTSDARLHPSPLTVVAYEAGRQIGASTVEPTAVGLPFTVPLRSIGGTCEVEFSVPTAIPAQVFGSSDSRALGLRFSDYAFAPRPSSSRSSVPQTPQAQASLATFARDSARLMDASLRWIQGLNACTTIGNPGVYAAAGSHWKGRYPSLIDTASSGFIATAAYVVTAPTGFSGCVDQLWSGVPEAIAAARLDARDGSGTCRTAMRSYTRALDKLSADYTAAYGAAKAFTLDGVQGPFRGLSLTARSYTAGAAAVLEACRV